MTTSVCRWCTCTPSFRQGPRGAVAAVASDPQRRAQVLPNPGVNRASFQGELAPPASPAVVVRPAVLVVVAMLAVLAMGPPAGGIPRRPPRPAAAPGPTRPPRPEPGSPARRRVPGLRFTARFHGRRATPPGLRPSPAGSPGPPPATSSAWSRSSAGWTSNAARPSAGSTGTPRWAPARRSSG